MPLCLHKYSSSERFTTAENLLYWPDTHIPPLTHIRSIVGMLLVAGAVTVVMVAVAARSEQAAFHGLFLGQVAPVCGNGIVDDEEECDAGPLNGLRECSATCEELVCGDGVISVHLQEECEPPRGDDGEYAPPQCGLSCTVPTCDGDDCEGGCKRVFLPACTASSSSSPASASSSSSSPSPASSSAASSVASSTVSSKSSVKQTSSSSSSSSSLASVAAVAASSADGDAGDVVVASSSSAIAAAVDAPVVPAPPVAAASSSSKQRILYGTPRYTALPKPVESSPALDVSTQEDPPVEADLTASLPEKPQPPDQLLPKECGDFILSRGEECDDGNNENGDGCTSRCRLEPGVIPVCGNGVWEKGEYCDDGWANSEEPDACRPLCVEARCGDSIVDSNEECDDGVANAVLPNACRPTCKLPFCGDGVVDDGEQCDPALKNGPECYDDCTVVPTCGDGILSGDEECDLGKENASDRGDSRCHMDCKLPRCGDGVKDAWLGEECDYPGNPEECNDNCTRVRCGDGIVQPNEQCDDQNRNNADACSNLCRKAGCGDGILQSKSGEECDDENRRSGDGCTDECKLEVGFYCEGIVCVSVCGDGVKADEEMCDDGNGDDWDGCTSSCVVRPTMASLITVGTGMAGVFATAFLGHIVYLVFRPHKRHASAA